MAVTRFYRPQQQQYISQFVPENLQVMQNALDRTQARADKTQGMVDAYEDELLKIKANPGEDTERLKGISKGLSDYAMDLNTNRETSDPQVAREVYRKIKEMRGNEDIAKIQSGYASKQAYDKLRMEYEKDPKGFITSDINKIAQLLLGPNAKPLDMGSVEAIVAALGDAGQDLLANIRANDPNWKEKTNETAINP